jgi:hypothetical protein
VLRNQDIEYQPDELVFQQGSARSAFLVVKQGEALGGLVSNRNGFHRITQ